MSTPGFVGRTDELKALEDAFETAAAGEAAAVLVGGEAGIGKTRLLAELCRRTRARGALAVTGVCVPGTMTFFVRGAAVDSNSFMVRSTSI